MKKTLLASVLTLGALLGAPRTARADCVRVEPWSLEGQRRESSAAYVRPIPYPRSPLLDVFPGSIARSHRRLRYDVNDGSALRRAASIIGPRMRT